MRHLDLDLLHALATVADAGSLSAAAPQLARSQSAVSEQIRKLEEICGVPLFSRGKKGVALTPAGVRLLIHARRLLALNEIAYQDMLGARYAGDLRLAVTDYFRPTAIAGILKKLRTHYPQLRLHVSIRKSALIELDEGDFDIGLSMRILAGPHAGDEGEGHRTRLRREPLAWVADASFAIDQWPSLPLIVLPATCSLQRFVVKTLEAHDVPFVVAHSASGIGGLQLALAAGLGISCLNASAIPAGIVRFDGANLPPLPDVEFGFLPPRPGEAAVVTEVRTMLANELA
jgi:DNA-binding transcriptional LysR family regulator